MLTSLISGSIALCWSQILSRISGKKILFLATFSQFDADFARDVPAEGYGGWKTADLPLEIEHTALVVMYAWDCGTREQYPGLHRAVEYIPRAQDICKNIFPRLLGTVRIPHEGYPRSGRR